MNAKVICIASAKGGSGKTGITATFGTFLSNLQKKVLLIDADFTTNGLSLLYLKEVKVQGELLIAQSTPPTGLYNAIANRTLCDTVKLSDSLFLVPANYTLSSENIRVSELALNNFHGLISELRKEYDYILIDAQAGADDMAEMAINRTISDEVVIVSEYDPMSSAGVERLKALFRDDLTYDRTWVLLNKMLPEFSKNFSSFLEVAKYLSPIPWDAEVVRAYARRKLAINTETGNEYTLSIIKSLKGLFGEDIKDELNEWISSKAAVIRQPIVEQYKDAEKEMEYLLLKKRSLNKRVEFIRTGLNAIFMALMVLMAVLFYAAVLDKDRLASSQTDNITLIFLTTIIAAFYFFIVNKSELIAHIVRQIRGKNSIESELNQARYDRQLIVTEEKLKRLEMLKTLDAEDLLSKRNL